MYQEFIEVTALDYDQDTNPDPQVSQKMWLDPLEIVLVASRTDNIPTEIVLSMGASVYIKEDAKIIVEQINRGRKEIATKWWMNN